MTTKDTLHKRVDKNILAELSSLRGKKRYLREAKAKGLLEKIIGLDLSRQDIETLLNRSWSSVTKVLSYHGVSVPRKLHYRYSDESLSVIVDYFEQSAAFVHKRDKEKLRQLKMDMVNAVKALQMKIGDNRSISANAIYCVARVFSREDLERIGRGDAILPLRWGSKKNKPQILDHWPEVSSEIKSLGLKINKILDQRKSTVADLSSKCNVSKKTIIQTLDFLKDYCAETEGTNIHVSEKVRGTVEKISEKQGLGSEEAFPVFDLDTKILVISHTLLGHKSQQMDILTDAYKRAEKLGVKFAVVVGGMIAGKPRKDTHGEFFILDPDEQVEYVVKNWPKASFKTYVLAGDEELSWKFNAAESICRQERKDLRYLGAWSAKVPIEGTDTILEFVYPREGARRTYTIGYRPQRHFRSILTALISKSRTKSGLKGLPRIIFNGRVLAQGETNRGTKSVLCPGMISQTPSMAAAEMVPSVGAIICELKFDKKGKLISDFDENRRPQKGGILMRYLDYTPYTKENDYGEFPECKDCSPHEQKMLMMLKNKPCTEGEISRTLNCSVDTVKALFKSLQEREFNIVFSETTKRVVWNPNRKEKFEPLDIDIKTEIAFGETSDAHFGSKFQQPSAMKMAHDYAADTWGAAMMFDAGDAFDGRFVYRGQESEVFAQTFDEQLEEAIKKWPDRLPTFLIGGNHDEKFWKNLIADLSRHLKPEMHPEITRCFDIVRQFAGKRKDITYLGEGDPARYCTEAQVAVSADGKIAEAKDKKSLVVLISHPSGGAGQFRTYKSQKYVENLLEYALSLIFDNVEKLREIPHVYLLGNWHVNAYIRYGGIDVYLLPCYQAQTSYLKAKGLTPDIGSWMYKNCLDENGHVFENTLKYLDLIPYVKEKDY